jgi:hypothetical protein
VGRRISVGLELEIGKYMANARGVTATTHAMSGAIDDLGESADHAGVDLETVATNADVAKHEVKDLGQRANAATRDMHGLTTAAEAADRSIRELGDKSVRTAGGMALLRRQIKDAEDELRRLAFEYNAVGDEQVLSDAKVQRSKLSQLRSFEREVKKIEDRMRKDAAEVEAVTAAPGLGSAGGGLNLPGLQPTLIAALVGAAVIASPIIGGVVGAAVTGAVGTGGLVGGILAAKDDPAVRRAAQGFAGVVGTEWRRMGVQFVHPIEDALTILGRDFESLDLAGVFAPAVPFVTEVARGIGNLAKEFLPRFSMALRDAQPLMDELGRDLPGLGKALGDMLHLMATGAGNQEALKDTFGFINFNLRLFGETIHFLSGQYERFKDTIGAVHELISGIPDPQSFREHVISLASGPGLPAGGGVGSALGESLDNANVKALQLSGIFGQFSTALLGPVNELNALVAAAVKANDEFTRSVNLILGIDDLDIRIARGWDTINGLARENGRSLSLNTEKGRLNREAILEQVTAFEQLREKTVDQTNDIAGADKAYNSNLRLLEQKLIKEGMSAKAVHAMIDPLFRVPHDISTNVHVGVKVDLVNPNWLLQQTVFGRDLIPKHAAGGPNQPGFNIYGERGPELHYDSGPGMTWTAAQTASMLGGGGGNSTITVIVKDTSGRTLRTEMIDDALGRGVPQATIRAAYP